MKSWGGPGGTGGTERPGGTTGGPGGTAGGGIRLSKDLVDQAYDDITRLRLTSNRPSPQMSSWYDLNLHVVNEGGWIRDRAGDER